MVNRQCLPVPLAVRSSDDVKLNASRNICSLLRTSRHRPFTEAVRSVNPADLVMLFTGALV